MPKHTRSASSSHRYSNPMPVSLAPASTHHMYAPRLSLSTSAMPATYYSAVPSSGPSSSMQQEQYEMYTAPVAPVGNNLAPPQAPLHQTRPSSGAWSAQDDQRLMSARAQGLNWADVQANYFPAKTANACRKRHERLMERKGADDWDNRKLEELAKEYMAMRKEIWSGLASRTGEKWNVVEQKCMSNGLKNLQSAARAGARRERMESGQSMQGYDDDSGISGLGLTPVDDLDASYSSPEGSGSGHSVGGSSGSSGYQGGYHTSQHSFSHAPQYGYGPPPGTHHGYTSSASSTGTSGGYGPSHTQNQPGSPYLARGQRFSSADMGIDAIINRPPRSS